MCPDPVRQTQCCFWVTEPNGTLCDTHRTNPFPSLRPFFTGASLTRLKTCPWDFPGLAHLLFPTILCVSCVHKRLGLPFSSPYSSLAQCLTQRHPQGLTLQTCASHPMGVSFANTLTRLWAAAGVSPCDADSAHVCNADSAHVCNALPSPQPLRTPVPACDPI